MSVTRLTLIIFIFLANTSTAATYQIEACITGMDEHLLLANHHAYMVFRVNGVIQNTVSFGKGGSSQVRINDDYVEPYEHRVILSSMNEVEAWAAWQRIVELYNSEGKVEYNAFSANCSKIASRVLDHYGSHEAAAWIKSQNSTANHAGSAAQLPLAVVAAPGMFFEKNCSIDIGKCIIS